MATELMTDRYGNGLAEVKRKLRHALNEDKVKLWLPPYTDSDGNRGNVPVDLIKKYSAMFMIPENFIEQALEDLRQHSWTKLLSKIKFEETGIATLILHVCGEFAQQRNLQLHKSTKLTVKVGDFKTSLEKDLPEVVSEMTLIFKGKILQSESSFEEQGVVNNCQVMVICIRKIDETHLESPEVAGDAERRVEDIKKLVEVLSMRDKAKYGSHRHFYLEIDDQDGRPIDLPTSEKQSLSKAMTLHELGRSLIKAKSYPEALLLLLEAEDAFCQCRSEILSVVDNYGVLCLDTVWCYLQMKNLDHLPDAESKLKRSRKCLEESYGSNMERAANLRGNRATVSVLFVRLCVMEGITAFYRGRYREAKSKLDQAESDLQGLRLDDSKVSQLMMMGFTPQESRIALRSCYGDITAAIDYITKRREEKRIRKEKEKKQQEESKKRHKLGKTRSGKWVDSEKYEYLHSMGFDAALSKRALKEADNNLERALEMIQQNPEVLLQESVSNDSGRQSDFPDDRITELMNMGFDHESSHTALEMFGGDIQRAAEELLTHNGVLPSSSSVIKSGSTADFNDTSDATSSGEDEEVDQDTEEKIAETMKGLTEEEDDYLDLSFLEELSLISEYRAIIESLGIQ